MRVMKDSGLAWIGNIPLNWSVEKFKYQFAPRNERNPGNATILSLYRELGIVPKDSRDDNHNVTSLDTSKYRYVRPGDFVVNKMKAWQGSTAVSDYEGVVSPAYYVYEFRHNDVDRKFFHYLFRCRAYAQQFALLSGGIREGQWDLPAEELYNIGIIVPPVPEQTRIATFLDERCGKIDEAIAKHKALIEKLDEYRKAVITRAVTKGVRGEREMKESGIDWVGQIPANWNMQKMLWMCKTITDYVASGSFADLAENVTYRDTPDYAMLIRTTDISNKGTSLKHVYVDKHSYDFLSNSNLFGGEVVLPNVGSVGEAYIVPTLYERMTLGPNAIVVRASKRSNDRFLYYFFNSYVGSLSLINLAQVTTQPKFNKTNFRALRGICPPIEEQAEIVAYLDEKCAAIDSAKERHTQLIAKLEEYKKSLIYHAVTGKIEC